MDQENYNHMNEARKVRYDPSQSTVVGLKQIVSRNPVSKS